ncbi:MAG: hypothetical protein RBS35_08490, partial [Azonexus sp.]|nr:hypothetical protein [Azonexus sp.]
TTSTTMTHTTTPATTNSCEIAGFVSQQNVFDAFIQDDLSRKMSSRNYEPSRREKQQRRQ